MLSDFAGGVIVAVAVAVNDHVNVNDHVDDHVHSAARANCADFDAIALG
jgi:hypothetical protein